MVPYREVSGRLGLNLIAIQPKSIRYWAQFRAAPWKTTLPLMASALALAEVLLVTFPTTLVLIGHGHAVSVLYAE